MEERLPFSLIHEIQKKCSDVGYLNRLCAVWLSNYKHLLLYFFKFEISLMVMPIQPL